jgi:predicted transcriptional regulator
MYSQLTPNDLLQVPIVFRQWLKETFYSSDLTMSAFAARLDCDRYTLDRIIAGEGFNMGTMTKVINRAIACKMLDISIPLPLKALHVSTQQEK